MARSSRSFFFFAGAPAALDSRRFAPSVALATLLTTTGCGYSQEEWDQQLRESEALKNQLAAQRQASEACSVDAADTKRRIAELRDALRERGIDLDGGADAIAKQRRAALEYDQRAGQIAAHRRRYELLSGALSGFGQRGVSVQVRRSRLAIVVAADALFDAGKDVLKPTGLELLKEIGDVIKRDPELSARDFQIAGHGDGKPPPGAVVKDDFALSLQRARAVLIALTDARGAGLTARRMSAAGYGAADPLSSIDDEVGQRRNRRIEIVLQPTPDEQLDLDGIVR